MPESPPIGNPSLVHSRLRAAGVWLMHRRRLTVLALLLAFIVGGAVWARPQLRAWWHLRAARAEIEHYHTSQAIRHLKVCREVWPNDPEVLLLSARAARRAGVYGDCERLLSLYEKERGRDDVFKFERLLLDAECNQDQVVERCWQLIEEGNPNSSLLMESLARGYMRRYRLGMARRCLDRWRQSAAGQPADAVPRRPLPPRLCPCCIRRGGQLRPRRRAGPRTRGGTSRAGRRALDEQGVRDGGRALRAPAAGAAR